MQKDVTLKKKKQRTVVKIILSLKWICNKVFNDEKMMVNYDLIKINKYNMSNYCCGLK